MAKLRDPVTARRIEINRWLRVFEADGNVAAAWRCLRLARLWNRPIPEPILAELDRIAVAFEDEVTKRRTTMGKGVGLGRDAVGRIVAKTGRGSADPAAALVAWERDFALASAVAILRHDGDSEVAAVSRVALGTHDLSFGVTFDDDRVSVGSVITPSVSVDVVRQAVRRVKTLFGDEPDGSEIGDLKQTPSTL